VGYNRAKHEHLGRWLLWVLYGALALLVAVLLLEAATQPDHRASGGGPSGPTEVDEGDGVTGPTEPLVLPAFTGSSVEEAKSNLKSLGLGVRVERDYSAEQPGTVIDQQPDSGASLDELAGPVTLIVSIYPKVPEFVGMTLAEAQRAARKLGLSLVVTRKASQAAAKTVLRQRVDPRKRVPAGTEITVTVVSPHVCGGPPLNPWCFTFAGGGSLIYDAPATLCEYFYCIPSFWESTAGYVIRCADGSLSHSGGRPGSCSGHDGNGSPLYRP
jgi:hypothetical protein